MHIYKNHLEQVHTQLQRIPSTLPILKLNPHIKDIFSFQYEDIQLEQYHPQASIKAPVAV